jgi:dTDP-4-dehydrorhamnose reductase
MSAMKIGITGSKGRIGRYLVSRGCVPLDCDITDPIEVSAEIFKVKPTVIINCAGISDVDYAQNNYKESTVVNVRGFYNLCSAAINYGAVVVGLSSDHVFSGKLWYPFTYHEHSTPKPINDYGWTKYGMESVARTYFNAYVVRTSFAFDSVRLAPHLSGVLAGLSYSTNVVRSFISFDSLAENLIYHATNINKMPKILHIAGTRSVSWYQFIKEFCEKSGTIKKIQKRRYGDIDGKAPRPLRTPLNINLALELGFPLHDFTEDFK